MPPGNGAATRRVAPRRSATMSRRYTRLASARVAYDVLRRGRSNDLGHGPTRTSPQRSRSSSPSSASAFFDVASGAWAFRFQGCWQFRLLLQGPRRRTTTIATTRLMRRPSPRRRLPWRIREHQRSHCPSFPRREHASPRSKPESAWRFRRIRATTIAERHGGSRRPCVPAETRSLDGVG